MTQQRRLPHIAVCAIVVLALGAGAQAHWLATDNVKVKLEPTEMGGPKLVVAYDLNDPNITPETPAYVFLRFSEDFGDTWQLVPMDALRGDGFDIVEKPGHKEIFWWGTDQTAVADLGQMEIRVRAIAMAKVPAGQFALKALPGGGRDESKKTTPRSNLPLYYIAKYETTVAMYADYLNEVGGEGAGWNARMARPERCGIVQEENHTYTVSPGRENYPVTYVSWYDAMGFLHWCGLRLPTETEWEKAVRGGLYLDGDETKAKPNPLPERSYPWGDEAPDANGVYRCNFDGEDDGFERLAPVGSFPKFASPYGVCDLAGNVAEWTLDWYSTSFHAGLDGFRMSRGGSWMAVPEGCDAITGATQLPVKESSIMGFRGVRGPAVKP